MEPCDGFAEPISRQHGYFQAQQSSLREQLSGRYVANHFHRVLGPQAQTKTWQAAADLVWASFSKFLPMARANSEKGIRYGPFAQGICRSSASPPFLVSR
jgi:hypothetical protein